MGITFLLILTFHKYWFVLLMKRKYFLNYSFFRSIILRRFFALSGTIFFLRSITMLVTSLSVSSRSIFSFSRCFEIDEKRLDSSIYADEICKSVFSIRSVLSLIKMIILWRKKNVLLFYLGSWSSFGLYTIGKFASCFHIVTQNQF